MSGRLALGDFFNWVKDNHLVFLSFLTSLRRQVDVTQKRIPTNIFRQSTDIYFEPNKENEEVNLAEKSRRSTFSTAGRLRACW